MDTASEYRQARRRLVQHMLDNRVIRTLAVEEAFLAVPREAFVPATSPAEVYIDSTIPVSDEHGEWITTSSQPTMMAIMLEQLSAGEGNRVLEIGAGTGYNAALLAHIVGPGGTVDSVEIDASAAACAASALASIESTARAHHGDGAEGWPDAAPFDRIIATVAVGDIPCAWEEQATPEARVVTPLAILGCDYSVALFRERDDWVTDSIEPCAFVRFRGKLALHDHRITIGDPHTFTLTLTAEEGELPPANKATGWLRSGRDEALRVLPSHNAWDGLALWLLSERRGERVFRAVSNGRSLGWGGHAVGIWDDDGMAMVTVSDRLEHYGEGDAAEVLRDCVADWKAQGAPGVNDLRIRLRPGSVDGPRWVCRGAHSLRVEEP